MKPVNGAKLEKKKQKIVNCWTDFDKAKKKIKELMAERKALSLRITQLQINQEAKYIEDEIQERINNDTKTRFHVLPDGKPYPYLYEDDENREHARPRTCKACPNKGECYLFDSSNDNLPFLCPFASKSPIHFKLLPGTTEKWLVIPESPFNYKVSLERFVENHLQ